MDTNRPTRKETTTTLLSELFKASALDSFLKNHEAALTLPTLPEYLNALCEEKGMERCDVVRRAGIDRSFGFQIFQGAKNPSRDKLIQLAIGFGLSFEETQNLMKIAQKPVLYPRIKRDAAILYCLNKRLSFTDAQAMLSGMELTILGRERD